MCFCCCFFIYSLECRTCIVVGNSFALKNRSLGRLINRYDVVIRWVHHLPCSLAWNLHWTSSVKQFLNTTVSGPFSPLYERGVHILGMKSSVLSAGVGRRQGCPLSPIPFLVFTVRIWRRSHGQGPRGYVSAFLQMMWLCWPPRSMTFSTRWKGLQLMVK